jgi:hypothetical protein
VLLIGALALLAVGVFTLRLGEATSMGASLVAYRLRFPRDLDNDAVGAFLAGVTGLLPPWWRRWVGMPFVVLELRASARGIEHQLLVPRAWAGVVENLIQAHLPGVRYSEVALEPLKVRAATEYRLTTNRLELRVEANEVAARLLSSVQPLHREEQLVVQWLLAAAPPVAPARVATPAEQRSMFPPSGAEPTSEAAAGLRAKQSEPLLLGLARVGATAVSAEREVRLVRQVEAAWHGTRAPGVHLRRRLMSSRHVASRLNRRAAPVTAWPKLLNTKELTGLLGWPVGLNAVSGLVLGGCRALARSPLVPSRGTVLGESNFPGSERPVAVSVDGRLRHLHAIGPTGTGKSTLLLNVAVQDLKAGHGLVVIDPKGDLVRDLLERIPESRKDDVILLDPADDERPVGLNPLAGGEGIATEVVVENLVGTFRRLYSSNWGPRTDDILRAALLTLVDRPNATLCEIPLLLMDSSYRRRLVGNLDDPIGLGSFWGWYEGLSDAERMNVTGPVMNKVRALVMRPRVRGIIGQGEPRLSMHDVLAKRKVLLVSLASGLLGSEASALLGAWVFAELWNATTARAGVPSAERRPCFALIDEWQNFVHLPTPMASVLAEARGLGLGLTLAHQHLGQLDKEAREAVLANARSRVVFQLPSQDARTLVPYLGSDLTADELQDLEAFEVVAQIYGDGRTLPSLTARTLPPPEPTSDVAEIREHSRQRYGVDRAEVESAIRKRQQAGGGPTVPVGRRPLGRGSAS